MQVFRKVALSLLACAAVGLSGLTARAADVDLDAKAKAVAKSLVIVDFTLRIMKTRRARGFRSGDSAVEGGGGADRREPDQRRVSEGMDQRDQGSPAGQKLFARSRSPRCFRGILPLSACSPI